MATHSQEESLKMIDLVTMDHTARYGPQKSKAPDELPLSLT